MTYKSQKLLLFLLLIVTAAFAWQEASGDRRRTGIAAPDARARPPVQVIADWPESARDAARAMITKYGQPEGVTDSRLIWQNKGTWREIIAFREEIPHNFPKPHKDSLEEVINYQVRPGKLDDVGVFDGSVIVERTKGTIAARCDKEPMNFLALNLANDLLSGKKSVREARKFYADTAMATMKGETPAYTQSLQFSVPQSTRDPDVSVMK